MRCLNTKRMAAYARCLFPEPGCAEPPRKKAEGLAPPCFKFRLLTGVAGQLHKGNDDLQDDPEQIQNQLNQFNHFPSPLQERAFELPELLLNPPEA